uniref:CUB domain-containing protein n=1 Tax=Macrostomum lignano TaxID=282301 RepID=A0A1I8FMI6_9PLAT
IRPHRRRRCPPTSSAASSGLAPQSLRDSTSHLTTFGRQGGRDCYRGFSGSVGAAALAGTTYQGQECSIRIVANPLESLQPARLTPRLGTSSMLGTPWPLTAPCRGADAHQQSPSESGSRCTAVIVHVALAGTGFEPGATPRFSRQLPPPYSASRRRLRLPGFEPGTLAGVRACAVWTTANCWLTLII